MAKFVSFAVFSVVLYAAMFGDMVGASEQFVVGGIQGWREPSENDTALYGRWAANNRFQIGDSLYFRYTNDSLLLVDKKGYYHCNIKNPIATFNDGTTLIKLDRSGPFYFISGFVDHCKNGQRLIVDVMTRHLPPLQTFSPAPSPLPSAAVSPCVSALTILMAAACWSLRWLSCWQ